MKIIKRSEVPEQIKNGKVGVIPTDTIYGLVASALVPEAVERVYKIKLRDIDKPSIVLIGDIDDLDRFGVTAKDKKHAAKLWPGPVSIIFHCPDEKWQYLHRGQDSLAFRLPNDDKLRDLLRQTGPLIAPSANPQAQVPARNIEHAKDYFGEKVDFYVDGGTLDREPSTVISFLENEFKVLRSHTMEELDYAKMLEIKAAKTLNRQITGFLDFIRERGVIGLAIGIVVGGAVTALVNTMVAEIINPVIGLMVSTDSLANADLNLHVGQKILTLGWGAFVSSLINFVIIAGVIYFGFKILRLDRLDKKD